MKRAFNLSLCLFAAIMLCVGCQAQGQSKPKIAEKSISPPTVGEGTIDAPAVGPTVAYNIGGKGFVLVKNWDFGKNGTIRNYQDMNTHFQYHDQFGTIANGTHYGAVMVAPDKENAISKQPIEDPKHPVREFTPDSLKTYLVPLTDKKIVEAKDHAMGCGSFVAKWTLPNGGKLLNQDLIFETRVRYVTPPYFWFAIWTAGNKWNKGAEADVVESFGYDNGGGNTNYDGHNWHADVVGGTNNISYKDWGKAMQKMGVLTPQKPKFDATQYHTWTWWYRTDDSYSIYIDGIEVQNGILHWTLKAVEGGEPLNMTFLFDAGWGHTDVKSVAKPLPVTEFVGKYYEWDYSRVYLRDPATTQPSKERK